MSEEWRNKTYYRPRVLIQQDSVLESSFPDALVCLTGGELAILRGLLAYAARRSTWVAEYATTHYVTPTTEDFDQLMVVVAELEDKLMGSLCSDLVPTLEALVTAVTTNGTKLDLIAANIDGLDLTVSVLAGQGERREVTNIVVNNWPDYPNTTDYFGWGSAPPNESVTPQADADACALAQAWYQATLEWLTEAVMPALRFGFDDLLPAAAAAMVVITGGTSAPVVLGVYTVAEAIQELLEIAYDAAESGLENFMWNNKEEIVCALYLGLRDGGTDADIWSTVQAEVIDPSGDISAGDKLLVGFLGRTVGLWSAKVAKTADSAWYQASVTPGYCDVCDTGEASFSWDFPPCPNGWWSSAVCWDGHLCMNHGKTGNSNGQYLVAPPVGTWDTLTYDLEWTSVHPSGWTVGAVKAFYWNGSGWSEMHSNVSITNTQAALSLNSETYVKTGFSEPGSRDILIQVQGQAGQYQSEPYPLQLYHVTATFSQA